MSSLLARIGIRPVLWLLLVGTLAAWTAGWIGSAMFADARIARLFEQERDQAQSDAELVSANLGQRLAQARSVAQALAQDPAIQKELAKFGPNVQASALPLAKRGEIWRSDPALKPLAERMALMVEKFDLTFLWVTNAAADTVAEGHSNEVRPFTGTNYADRAYFKAAQQGQNGRQFAIGRATNVYGLFFSSPVQVEGQFVGMVGAGLAVPKLSVALEQVNAVVTDDLGVIVLAKDPALLMQIMPGATVSALSLEERDNRYKRQEFAAVELYPALADGPQYLYRWRDLAQPYIIANHPTSDGAMRVYVLRELGEPFYNSRRDQLWWFGLVSVVVILIAALMAGAAQFVINAQIQQSELQQLNQALTRQANTDVLTGCANRRFFMNALQQERHRSSRYDSCFCVLSMDIDYFKRVNDTFGHAAGDQVLKHFVANVQGNLRDTDTLGRLGGEEFSVLLPQTTAEGGASMAERIRASVQTSPAIFGSDTIAITVSIGGAQWQPGNTQSVDEVLAFTDEALYTAKHSGRNRVQWAQIAASTG